MVVVLYSVRVPFSGLTTHALFELKQYQGVKAVFLQDEYDRTRETFDLLVWAEFDLLFSSIGGRPITDIIYRESSRGGIEIVPVYTGYFWPRVAGSLPKRTPSDKKIHLVYRGRDLDSRYGRFADWKRWVPLAIKAEGRKLNLIMDIEIEEGKRLYNRKWSKFLESGKSTLILPSGSDIFDSDGELENKLAFPSFHGYPSDSAVLREYEVPEFRGVISPRVFEALAVGTCLVGLAGWYSGLLQADKHYIALNQDLTNLRDVLDRLKDEKYLDELWQNAHSDLMEDQNLSYLAMVSQFDTVIDRKHRAKKSSDKRPTTTLGYGDHHRMPGETEKGLTLYPVESPGNRGFPKVLAYIVRRIVPSQIRIILREVFLS